MARTMIGTQCPIRKKEQTNANASFSATLVNNEYDFLNVGIDSNQVDTSFHACVESMWGFQKGAANMKQPSITKERACKCFGTTKTFTMVTGLKT